MIIKDIVIRELKVPLVHSYALSQAYGVQIDTSNIIVEVHTDEGLTGWGESDPWPAFTGDTADSVVVILEKCLAPVLIGQDPTKINDINELMDKTLRANATTKASIDMACHDILGKSLGVPVHQLIGGKQRDNIRCFWAVGGSTPEETAQEVLEIKKQGFWGCMIKIGTDWKLDAARTNAVREAVGDEFPLIVDANQGWDTDTAIAYGNAVASANLLFFEQPVKYWDVEGMATIRKKVPMPISADEGISSIQEAKALIKAEACDFFSIKISKMGGIMKAKQICDYADQHGIKLFFNSMLEEGITQASSLHVASTVPNILQSTGHSFFSTLRLKGDITDFCRWTKKGITYVPDKSGLGFDLNYENLNRFTVRTVVVAK